MKLKFITSVFFLSVCVFFNACRKNERDNDTETQSAIDVALVQSLFDDVFKQVYKYAEVDSVFKLAAPSCDTSYITPDWPITTFPKTQTVKFDTVYGCVGTDGQHRKGKIKIVYTGMIGDSLSKATVTFIDYYVNGYKITGTNIITNKGHNVSGQLVFTSKLSGVKIVNLHNETILFESNQILALSGGETTITQDDDVFSITGSGSGTNSLGNTFTANIKSALRFEISCKQITSGVIAIQPAKILLRELDFGTGMCDNDATVAISTRSFDVTLQ